MKFLRSFPEWMFKSRTARVVIPVITGLLMACIFLLSTSGIAQSQCPFNPGDVNAYQGVTALADAVYFARYFHGGDVPPIDCSLDCPSGAGYDAGDVNGNCQVNGIDLTYLVSYWAWGQNPLNYCINCTPTRPGNSDPSLDPGADDGVALGDPINGLPINVVPGEVVSIPVWVMNDENLEAFTISFTTDDQYLTPEGGTFLPPLDNWSNLYLTPEVGNPPGYTTQTILCYRNLNNNPGSDLNTQGQYVQVATFVVRVSLNPPNPPTTDVVCGNHSRIRRTAFCAMVTWGSPPPAEQAEEWYPACQPTTLNIGPPISYGTIAGTVFYDPNNPCVQDQGDVGLPNWTVWANNSTYSDSRTTDQLGNYMFSNIPVGTYTVSEDHPANWTQTCPWPPPGEHIVGLNPNDFIGGISFGNVGSSSILDLSCYVGGTCARPGFYKSYGITYQNIGNVPSDATVIFTLPADVLFNYCSGGGSYDIVTRKVTWPPLVLGLLPPRGIGWLSVIVLIPANEPLGTWLTSSVEIQPVPGPDNNPSDNLATETQEVRGSVDPNEKLVSPEGVIERTDMLTYQINFQNVGTAPALTVVVRDTLDANLDLSTFTSGASIHPYTYAIAGREITWTFADINLPDSISDEAGSHGFVKFTAIPIPSVPAGTIIENRASIFFDFNPAVITNTVSNQIASPPPCSYVPGDANGNGEYNGIDVSYTVNYLKGMGGAPIDSCDCPPWSFPLYAAADANGNCAFNGIDVTYSVNYLKGIGPNPQGCPDCPGRR